MTPTFSKKLISFLFFILVLGQAMGQDLIHNFEFNGNLNDSKSGTALTSFNTATASFGTNPNSWTWTQSASPGGGLELLTDQLTDPENYSLGFRISYENTGNADGSTKSYKKILSFKGPNDDNGLYFNHQNLQFFPFGANTSVTYTPNTFYDFVFTRTKAGVLKVFIVETDGTVTEVYSENDTNKAAVPRLVNGKYEFRFFMNDNTATENTTGGSTRSIRVWDGPLSSGDIAAALSSVTTGDAEDVGSNIAIVTGEVNPQGNTATFFFDYGTTTSYGQTVTATPASSSGNAAIAIKATLTGLQPGVTYHYRLKSSFSGAYVYGSDKTFSTSSPGGVTGSSLWLKANEGVTNNGNTLTGWVDQTGANNFSVNGAPGFQSDKINFNPVVSFDNTESNRSLPGDYLVGDSLIKYVDGFAVFRKTHAASGTLIGNNQSGFTYGTAIFAGYGANDLWMTDGSYAGGNHSHFVNPLLVPTNPVIVGYDIVDGLRTSAKATLNGEAQTMQAGAGNSNSGYADITPWIGGTTNIGGRDVASGWAHFRGEVAEIILFPASQSDQDKLMIQSYLAIKYGITLDPSVGQYVASDGTAIWNFTSYWNDVFGIGTDTDSGLEQASSNAMNTGSGDGTGQSGLGNIVLSNPSSMDDKDFLMMGHDKGSLVFSTTSTTGFGQLGRKWKVKRTGDVGTVDLAMDLSGITINGSVTSAFRLQIDTDGDGDFSTGTITQITPNNFRNNVLEFNSINLPEGAVFTFAQLHLVPITSGFPPNRIIVNPSFETGSIVPHSAVEYPQSQNGDSPELDGWYTTHPDFLFRGTTLKKSPIEHWRSGNNSVAAQQGDYFVELNVNQSSRLYQYVYLVSGETVDWTYHHRKREAAKEELVYSVYSSDGSTKIREIDRHEATDTHNWQERTGQFTWNLQTGIYQIGFEATTPGGSGNFLDNLNIGLKALVEFSADTIRLSEGASIAPYFFINGQVQSASSFTVSVNSGTAVEGTDYQFTSKTKSIPVGNYAIADSLALNFSIIDNDIPQNDRTIVLTIASTSGDVDRLDANADGVYQQTLVVIIEDDDPCKNPGTDGTLSFCASGATDIDLFAGLQGTVDSGGSWSDDGNSMVDLSDASNVDFSSLAVGTYGFTYSFPQSGICAAHQASVSVTIKEPFPLGESNTLTICNASGTTVKLIDELNGSPVFGGHWVPSNGINPESLPHAVDTATIDFSNKMAGTYAYIYFKSGEKDCDGHSAQAKLTINVIQAVNAGTDNTVNECTDTPLNLFTSLGGSPDSGGAWVETTSSGAVITDPTNVDFSGVTAGSYTFEYTVSGTSPCSDAVSTLTVNVDTQHNAGSAGTESVCNDGSTVDLFANLGGTPDPGGTWADTDATGVNISNPTVVDFSGITAGDYDFTYTLTGSGSCTDESAVVSVTVSEAPNTGTDNTVHICDGGSSTVLNLFASLGGSPDMGGTWTDNDHSGVTLGDGTAVDFAGVAPGYYYFDYEILEPGPCNAERSSVIVYINHEANPGSNTRLRACEDGIVNFADKLLGNPDPGGTWSEISAVSSGVSLSNPALVDLAGVPAGDYTFLYTIAGDGVCQSKSATLFLTIQAEADAGTDGAINVCNENATPVNLFDQIGGTPDTGGVWHDFSHAADFMSGDLAGFGATAPGTYRFLYLISEPTKVCSPKASSVYVTVDDQPDAGSDGHVIVCDGGTGTVKDLFGSLGGSPDNGGTWTDLDGSGANLSVPTAVDFDAIAAGNYNFRYVLTAAGSCANDTSVVSVTVDQDPNAGTNTSKTICNGVGNAQSINLLDQMEGSPTRGGTWTFTSTETFDISDPTQANISGASGTYELTYTISGTGTCSDASSTLTLEIEGDLYAGDRGQVSSVCTSGSTIVDLTALLGGSADMGGTWADVDGSGVDLSDPTAVDFAGLSAQDYDFSYTVTNTCGTDVATNAITVVAASDAGTNGTLAVCNDNTAVNLFAALGGTPESGGYWSDNQSSGLTLGDGSSVDFSGLKKGTYKFSYHVEDSPCAPDVATVTVTVNSLPYAGMDQTVLLCDAGDLTVDFISAVQITSTLSSEWTDNNNAGVDLSSLTAVDFTRVANGTYTFTHAATGQGNCGNTSATLTVKINENGNAGTDGNMTVCNTSSADLTSGLGSSFDSGGTWSDDDNSGVDLFDPTDVSFNGVSAGTYDFTYSLSATSGCTNSASATVSVTVDALSATGNDNSLSICNGATIDLGASLAGSPDTGGVWSETTSSGVDISDPANVDFSAVSTGRYEFVYTQSTATCASSSATLIVNVGASHDAGTSGSLAICNTTSNYDLESAIGNPDPGGVWTDTDQMGIDLSDPNAVDFSGVSAGTYRITHTHAGDNGCSTSSAVLNITLSEPANAGTNASLEFCSNFATHLDLFSSLGGNPATGGSWVDVDGSGVSLADPTNVDLSGLSAGNYHFNYVVASTGSCTSSTATVTVEIVDSGSTGTVITDPVVECTATAAEFDLTSNLSGFDSGGIMTINGQTTADSTQFDLSILTSGFYEVNYDIAAIGNCTSSNTRYYIEMSQGANAGQAGSLKVCRGDGAVSLFDAITGSYDTGGTWTDLDNAGVDLSTPDSVVFDQVTVGTYTFQYDVVDNGNCGGDQSNIISVEVCSTSSPEVKIKPSGGFSPDGDGINDHWEIPDIEQYPNNRVEVFNRWGQLIFSIDGYDNQSRVFLGEANHGTVVGNSLPDGTYFYLIDLGNGTAATRGFITIVK